MPLGRIGEDGENGTNMKLEIVIQKYHGVDLRRTWRFDRYQEGLTDDVIIPDNQIFHVSKAILSLHSPYFLQQFQKSSTIHLSDVSGETVIAILDMIHPPYNLPKNWVEHGFEWQKYHTREVRRSQEIDYSDSGSDYDEYDEDQLSRRFKANGRLNLDRIIWYYRVKWPGQSIYFLLFRSFYFKKFLDDYVDKEDEKNENEKFGYTNKYIIMKAAKQLKLSEKACRQKFKVDMLLYDNEDDDEIIEPSCRQMNTFIDSCRFNARLDEVYDYLFNIPMISTGKVIVGDETFHVCTQLLSYHSSVFRAMFSSSSEIVLTDTTPADFREVLNWIYPTMLTPKSWNDTFAKEELDKKSKMLEFFHKYKIDIIKERIVKSMMEPDDVKHAMGWMICMADQYDMPNMMEFETFMATDQYATLSEKTKNVLIRLTEGRRAFRNERERYEKYLKENGANVEVELAYFDITH